MNVFRNLRLPILFFVLPALAVFLLPISIAKAEVEIGDVYAGNGCARVGDIVAGDCKGERDNEDTEVPSSNETTAETTLVEDTSSLTENTTEETSFLESDTACPSLPDGDVHRATVERVIDGDTLQLAETVAGTDTVRMIGVDSPEMESDGAAEPEPGAEGATRFTSENLEGERVLLETDEVMKDGYGRLLAYVWIEAESGASENAGLVSNLMRIVGMDSPNAQPRLFNLELIEGGYAEVLTIPPNDSYAECFENAVPTDEQSIAENQYTDTEQPEETIPEITESTSADDAPVITQYVEGTEATTPETEIPSPEETNLAPETPVLEQTTPQGEATSPEPDGVTSSVYPSSGLAGSTPDEPATGTYVPSEPASESGTLPTVETPDGPVAVLPDTGGLPVFELLMLSTGFISLAAGLWGVHYSLSRRSGPR
ncbi:thermonuclease family protein [Rubrobacter radiotolerans]|uniref:Thermonuclease family protein n=1 Tax=Rubrobacter radiotolerans TaxID=42256 RepID=A0AB35T6U0_RUBRA|nr:thermonuclease family protein [Rubrobacter radiotolerans]MDX5895183.1 thermonuclease family protein [Rubrobacter radiotolerans]SMC07608.1 nuclease homologue [Rubrobacter radiotolerans DSM 5868]